MTQKQLRLQDRPSLLRNDLVCILIVELVFWSLQHMNIERRLAVDGLDVEEVMVVDDQPSIAFLLLSRLESEPALLCALSEVQQAAPRLLAYVAH